MPSHLGILVGAAVALILILVMWLLVSIPVWLASKVIARRSTIGRAMIATLVGVIVYLVIAAIFSLVSPVLGVVLGLLGVLLVFKSVFGVGWLGALGIALLAVIFWVVILAIISLLGLSLSFPLHLPLTH
jgi:hypothetical protein